MTTDLQKAGEISRHVQLREILLRSARIHTSLEPLSEPPDEMSVATRYRTSYAIREERPDLVFVSVDFDVAAETASAEQNATLAATFLAIYELPNAGSFDPESLEHFAALNGVYNLWPYLRELVQTAFGRLGLGSVVLPVYRVTARKLKEEPGEPEPVGHTPSPGT